MAKLSLALLGILVLAMGAPPARAAEVRQLTQIASTSVHGRHDLDKVVRLEKIATLDSAATISVYINASTNQFGTNPTNSYQILKFNAATGAGSQVTSLPKGVSDHAFGVSVSDDGQWLAFLSSSDPLGQNHDQSLEVFVMRPDGSQLSQLTNDPAPNSGSATMVVLSGSANRVIFVSGSNLTGNNAARRPQLFAINRDGTGLAQLTQSVGGTFRWISISDNGQRVAFCHDGDLVAGSNPEGNVEVFAINFDGTNLRQMTATTGDALRAAISGNGTTIAFDSTANFAGTNADGGYEIFTADWTTGILKQVTNSHGTGAEAVLPSMTDNAATIVFTSSSNESGNPDGSHDVCIINTDGSNFVRLTNLSSDFGRFGASVSGNGQRIAYSQFGNQLQVMAGNGNGQLQVMQTNPLYNSWPDISADGSRIVYSATAGRHLYRVQADGSGLFQLTNFQFDQANQPSVSGDGSVITFMSSNNATGQNAPHKLEIFRINADGTGLQQLTFTSAQDTLGYSVVPTISEDGSKIAFTSRSDLLGQYEDPYTAAVYCMNSDGSNLALVTPTATQYSGAAYQQMDSTGTWLVFHSYDDLVAGQNADLSGEIFRAHCDGSGTEQITSSALYSDHSLFPDIDGSGQRIVWSSTADPLGTNPEHNSEIFLYEPVKGKLRQLTATNEGNSHGSRLSTDGAWVYFISDGQFFEDDPDSRYDLFRIQVDTNLFERVGALGVGDVFLPSNRNGPIGVNGDGSRAVFSGDGNFTGTNPDLFQEIWLVDQQAPQRIGVSSGPAPTTISWAPEPRSIRYDVIRGTVGNLAANGGTVDLGAVVCLENDSPDADTNGSADGVSPAPGQAFFYVFRGSQGVDDGPGSYGAGSGGGERVPSSGGCQ